MRGPDGCGAAAAALARESLALLGVKAEPPALAWELLADVGAARRHDPLPLLRAGAALAFPPDVARDAEVGARVRARGAGLGLLRLQGAGRLTACQSGGRFRSVGGWQRAAHAPDPHLRPPAARPKALAASPPPDCDASSRRDLTHLAVYTVDDAGTTEVGAGAPRGCRPHWRGRWA